MILDACYPNQKAYCYNGGTCTIDDNGGAKCDCLEGFSGPQCDVHLVSAIHRTWYEG